MAIRAILNQPYPATARTVSTNANLPAVDVSNVPQLSIHVDVSAISTPSGATLQLQRSNNGTSWANVGAAFSVTATGTNVFEVTINTARFVRLVETIGSGSFTYTGQLVGLGY